LTVERLEKIIPLSCISICLLAIILRIVGVLPPIVATSEFEISRTIFVDAGIGGLLAVFAIVISLTLMGIQFASQEYTHRVMNTYLQSYMLWSMMASYLFTVLFNLYLVAFLKQPINTVYTDISLLLQSLCLILLIPHFVIAVFHLKPDYTINRLFNSIDADYLISMKEYLIKGKSDVPHKIDRLLPAVEILEKSIERGDRATVRTGLEGLVECYKRYVNPENEDWLSRYFMDFILRLGREAVIESDDDSIVQVLEILGEIGNTTTSHNVANIAVDNIRNTGTTALKKEFDAAVEQMIDSLYKIVLKTTDPKVVQSIREAYAEIVSPLFNLEKRVLLLYLTNNLSSLIINQITAWDTAVLKQWVRIIEDIGHLARVQPFMREVVHTVIHLMCEIGIAAARQKLETANHCVDALMRIERQIDKTDRELFSEINFAKQEIETVKEQFTPKKIEESGINTSDLW